MKYKQFLFGSVGLVIAGDFDSACIWFVSVCVWGGDSFDLF